MRSIVTQNGLEQKLLERILNEQCRVSSTENGRRVSVKEPKQIPSDSLQNPY